MLGLRNTPAKEIRKGRHPTVERRDVPRRSAVTVFPWTKTVMRKHLTLTLSSRKEVRGRRREDVLLRKDKRELGAG